MRRISLDGTWSGRINFGLRGPRKPESVHREDDRRCSPCQVPGEVHLDLMRAGLLDDVYVGMNVLKARWVEECTFYYTRTFDLTKQPGERVFLTLEGLDLDAEIFVNDRLCGEHHNFYTPCHLDVTEAVQEGNNRLTVRISSGLLSVSEKPVRRYQFAPELFDHLLHKRQWLRKPQFEFGWDWSERLVNVGIQGHVFLTVTRDPFVEQIQLLPSVSEDGREGTLRVRAFCRGEGTAELEIEVDGSRHTLCGEIRDGVLEGAVTLPHPRLWYPVGYGEANVYEVGVRLLCSGREIGAKRFCTGFRTFRVRRDRHPERGSYFILEVNGKPVFAKGANLVPADMILSNITEATYRKLTDEALEANFNMLRVWGGGLYESDFLYELCSRKGILMWQEFIFACMNYPGEDPEFREQIRQEAEFQVRRLSGNPCLVVWCGNNEINWLKAQVPDLSSNEEDRSLYRTLLAGIVRDNAPEICYHESSPMSDSDDVFPNDEYEGDQHPWDVGFEMVDYRKYREMHCRFPNEGGLNGSSSLLTARASYAGKTPEVHAPEFVLHDNYIDLLEVEGHSACNYVVWDNLGFDPLKIPYEQFCYLAGLAQGEGLKEYIDRFRARKWDSASAIFWMYNDCWPTVRSWTILDYYGRRTPSFDRVRKAFQPFHIAYVSEGGELSLVVLNESAVRREVELESGVCSTTQGFLRTEKRHLDIGPGETLRIPVEGNPEHPEREFLYAMAREDGKLIAANRWFFARVREMQFLPARIEAVSSAEGTVLTSDVFAYGVCVDLDGEARVADNFFELYPGVPFLTGKDVRVLYCYNNLKRGESEA